MKGQFNTRQLLIFISLVSLFALMGCCKKCDLKFEESELGLLSFELDSSRPFRNSNGETISLSFRGTDVEESGKVCGGFGPPEDDFCSVAAYQTFRFSKGQPDLSVQLWKTTDSSTEVDLVVEIENATHRVAYEDLQLSSGSQGQLQTVSINGTVYDDVLDYFFDPNIDCKDPTGNNCVKNGQVVAFQFSLSTGLISFEIHRGLQTPNDRYEIEN